MNRRQASDLGTRGATLRQALNVDPEAVITWDPDNLATVLKTAYFSDLRSEHEFDGGFTERVELVMRVGTAELSGDDRDALIGKVVARGSKRYRVEEVTSSDLVPELGLGLSEV